MVLTALIAIAAAADPLYVVATSLNLRAEPKPAGKLVYVARIGEQCTAKGPAAKGWYELDCAAFHGFAKSDFLSATKPTAEALDAHFDELKEKDDRASWDERFVTAQRAIALGGSASAYRDFVSDYFEAMQRLGSDGNPVKTVTPYIRPQTQDADGEGSSWIERELGLESTGFGYGKVLPDGTAWFYSGRWGGQNGYQQWTSYFQYHAIVLPAFAPALGAKGVTDACPMTGAPLLCAAPAGKTCGALPACHSCKVQCAATCNDCRLACKLGSMRKLKYGAPGPWETCVTACVPGYATCAAACDSTADCK